MSPQQSWRPLEPRCLEVQAHTTATQTRDFNAFHSGVLSQLAHIFQRHQVTG